MARFAHSLRIAAKHSTEFGRADVTADRYRDWGQTLSE